MVIPRTYLLGVTQPDRDELLRYLRETGQEEFMRQFEEAEQEVGGALCLVSFYAKLCYKSLVLGKNSNVTATRDILENLTGCLAQGHGSVFEHVTLNFVTTNCSRVFTHELVRHRAGTAFSQTSGRYVSIDSLDLVLPPELTRDTPCEWCRGEGTEEGCDTRCRACDGLCTLDKVYERARSDIEIVLQNLRMATVPEHADFATKKRLTSAIRRLAPNGQANEIGWSANVRALRHIMEMRTSPVAEWEMRQVFNDVYDIVAARWPLMLHGAEVTHEGGLIAVEGLGV
jgi:thymidylate synthase (FAD)